MGTEYEHWLFVADERWRPDENTARRVHQVLLDHELVDDKPTRCTVPAKGPARIGINPLTGERLTIRGARKPKPAGKGFPTKRQLAQSVLIYDKPPGGPPVEKLFPSVYAKAGQAAEGRHLQSIRLILGHSLHVYDTFTEEGAFVKTDVKMTDRIEGIPTLGAVAGWDGQTRPRASVEGPRRQSRGWDGLWMAGLGFDYGKDLPKMARGGSDGWSPIPKRKFVKQLAQAFGAELVEAGFCY